MTTHHQLIASKGTGSQLVELAFAAAKLPLEVRYIPCTKEGLTDAELTAKNPLAQVPTLILPDGSTLTESAAIIMRVNDLAPEASLIPKSNLSERTRFFQWLMIINAAIYPTFTYGDFPPKWLPDHPEAHAAFRQSTDEHRCKLWNGVEAEAQTPWFLGKTFSAIDFYIFVMNSWRPRSDWFEANAPKLSAIAKRLEQDSRFQEVIVRNHLGT